MRIKNKFIALLIAAIIFTVICLPGYGRPPAVSYYQLKVYHYNTAAQQAALHRYLQQAYLPALHRNGVKQAGVFATMPTDTLDKRVYVFIPLANWNDMQSLDAKILNDKQYLADAKAYTGALYNAAPYNRLEVILLKAFAGMLQPAVPALAAPKSERVYELRSYESATENYHADKVSMFNEGNEIGIFKRLGFNAVFYGSVMAGSRMPNLMYMTVFANKEEREKHWASFIDDGEWKTLKAKAGHENNVSKIDVTFLQAAEYSDF